MIIGFLKTTSMKKLICIFTITLLFSFSLFTQDIVDINILPPQKSEIGEILVTYNIPEGQYQSLQKEMFFFTIESEFFSLGEIEYPKGKIENSELPKYRGATVLKAPLIIAKDVPPGEYSIKVSAGYQFCEEETGLCFFPSIVEKTSMINLGEVSSQEKNSILTLIQYILMAFLGGLLLNIMPCVLPVLSIKAISLVKQGNKSKKEIRTNALLYGAGIVASLVVLSIIVITLKLSGEAVGWGFQFQNPKYVLGLLTIIFIFALSLFDVFIITMPGTNSVAKISNKDGYVGSFLTGIFAVVLATPCTAPFMGAALGFAFSQPPITIFLVFLFLAIGLALPFTILGWFPNLVQKIPKPGEWMNTFKEVMGFLLIGTSLWLFNVLYHQIDLMKLPGILLFLLFVSMAAWLYGKLSKPGAKRSTKLIGLALALGIIFTSAFYFVDLSKPSENTIASKDLENMWETFSTQKMESLRSQEKPVFVIFSAEWCLTCKTNEKGVLNTEEIKNLFKKYNVSVLYGDYTNGDEEIDRWIKSYGKAGVPVYAFYPPGVDEPVLFPEILSKTNLIQTFTNHLDW